MAISWCQTLARRIADQTNVGEGTKVAIFTSGAEAQAAVRALVAEVYGRGGTPQVLLTDPEFDRSALASAPAKVLATPAPLQVRAIRWADVQISFRAMSPPRPVRASAERRLLQRKAAGIASTLRWNSTRWIIVRVPTPAWARMVGKPYAQLRTEFIEGCLTDWSTLRQHWDALAHHLAHAQKIHITAPDTDLVLGVKERRWLVLAGDLNLPDGELATAPEENSAEGYITFPGPFWFADARFENLYFEFRNGSVSSVSASVGQDLASTLVSGDAGSKRIGEFGIGVNPRMRTLVGDLFFDEKVLGTVHIALGRAYPQCGGSNMSFLHWDIVKDLRRSSEEAGGSVDSDMGPLLRNGTLVYPEITR